MNNKDELKEKAINLYLNGNTYEQVGKILGHSRDYISDLISHDERIIQLKYQRKIKIENTENGGRIYINKNILYKMGLKNGNYVNIIYDKNQNQIIIKKAKTKGV